MDLEQLRDLIRLFEESSLHEIEIEEEGRRMSLKKHLPQQVVTHTVPMSGPPAVMPQLVAQPGQTAAPAPAAEVNEDAGLPTINSPMVGTFYSSPAPGEPPFVQVGDVVDNNQAVCIVEAMKLMNEVTAKFRAEIVKVLL